MLRVTILLQALINGLMAGTILAVPAIGFTAIFAVLRYPNFAVASYATIGAFAAWSPMRALGLAGRAGAGGRLRGRRRWSASLRTSWC